MISYYLYNRAQRKSFKNLCCFVFCVSHLRFYFEKILFYILVPCFYIQKKDYIYRKNFILIEEFFRNKNTKVHTFQKVFIEILYDIYMISYYLYNRAQRKSFKNLCCFVFCVSHLRFYFEKILFYILVPCFYIQKKDYIYRKNFILIEEFFRNKKTKLHTFQKVFIEILYMNIQYT